LWSSLLLRCTSSRQKTCTSPGVAPAGGAGGPASWFGALPRQGRAGRELEPPRLRRRRSCSGPGGGRACVVERHGDCVLGDDQPRHRVGGPHGVPAIVHRAARLLGRRLSHGEGGRLGSGAADATDRAARSSKGGSRLAGASYQQASQGSKPGDTSGRHHHAHAEGRSYAISTIELPVNQPLTQYGRFARPECPCM
jgi:hypothetical protein